MYASDVKAASGQFIGMHIESTGQRLLKTSTLSLMKLIPFRSLLPCGPVESRA